MIRVVQLSDTHFAEDGHRSHRGFGYDTDAAFDAVSARAFAQTDEPVDFVVVTGDVADNGLPDEYDKARAHFETISGPLYLTPGNHDFQVPFDAGVGGLNHSAVRGTKGGIEGGVEIDNWLFLFADSNHDGKRRDDDGMLVDKANRVSAAGGKLGDAERGRLTEAIEASDAEHVWIWLHHPPGMHLKGFTVDAYDDEIREFLEANERVRGLGAGHVHTDTVRRFADRWVHVCPALTINLDYETFRLLPPGFRRYEFHENGRVESRCELIDDERWPRHQIPDLGIRFLLGEAAWKERKKARAAKSRPSP